MKHLLSAIFLISLFLFSLPTQANAHITDPAHSPWMVDLSGSESPQPPGNFFGLQGSGTFVPEEPVILPEQGIIEYEIILPVGFTISSISFSGVEPCVIQAETAHCTLTEDLKTGLSHSFFITGTTGQTDGLLQATMNSTVKVNNILRYSDSDTFTFNVQSQRVSDLSISMNSSTTEMVAGEPTILDFVLTNNGPEDARNASVNIGFNAFGGNNESIVEEITTPDKLCELLPTEDATCSFETFPAGESKTVSFKLIPVGISEHTTMGIDSNFGSYELDPITENNATSRIFTVSCFSYIQPGAIVDPTAKIASEGCTIINADAIIKSHVKVGKGSNVSGIIGEHAKIGDVTSIVSRGDLIAEVGKHSEVGSNVFFVGAIKDHVKVEDGVVSVADWVILENGARIGRGSSFNLVDLHQTVLIKESAKIPDNTVINETYCQNNPNICTIY